MCRGDHVSASSSGFASARAADGSVDAAEKIGVVRKAWWTSTTRQASPRSPSRAASLLGDVGAPVEVAALGPGSGATRSLRSILVVAVLIGTPPSHDGRSTRYHSESDPPMGDRMVLGGIRDVTDRPWTARERPV
jgi:hypothetical protein